MAEVYQERAFDRANYPLGDQAFWSKFDQLWTNPAEEPSHPQSLPDSTPMKVNKEKGKRRKIPIAQSKRMQEERRRELQEVVHLTRNCDPNDRAKVKAHFKAWRRRFTRSLDHMLKGKAFHAKHKLLGEDELARLLALGDVEEMRQAWQSEPQETRLALWPDVMLSALRTKPSEAHVVLQATFDESATPSYAVKDVVRYLVRRSMFFDVEERRLANKAFLDLILFLLKKSPNRYLQLPQWVLYTLAKGLQTDELANLYGELVRHEHLLHTNTLLHFASRLAKDAKHKSTSLQILESIMQSGNLDINTPRGAALCTSILSMNKDDMKRNMPVTPAELFERLLDLGLSPNLLTYTVIIRNLCLNRELDTAWQVFDTMIEHNIKPDARLYSILLNGAKLCQDFKSIYRVVQAAQSDNVRDPIVWNDLLHALYLPWLVEARRKGIRPPRVLPGFRPMLKAYAKFFKLDPLRSLTFSDIDEYLQDDPAPSGQWQAESKVLPLVAWLPTSEPQDLLEPGSDTLAIMLIGYVRGFSKAYNIISFYSQFRSLLQRGDPSAVRLVKERGTLVYDVVIKAVLEWDGLLHVALEVASDMLKGAQLASIDPSSLPAHANPLPRHPAPSVYTWSILLNGFMFHRKTGEAERILRMMREYGVEPSIVTWNTLLAGYTRDQHIEKTAKTFQRIETAGLVADDFTFRAFSYLKDKDRALELMEEMVARRKRWLEKERELDDAAGKQGPESDGIVGQLRELESEAERFDGMTDDEHEHERVLGDYDDEGTTAGGAPRY
jgi:pentatricopeptide repeat protein